MKASNKTEKRRSADLVVAAKLNNMILSRSHIASNIRDKLKIRYGFIQTRCVLARYIQS